MAIKIGDYQFEGPYTHTDHLHDRSGVYAILDVQPNQTFVVDIGESAQVKTRIQHHDRAACWQRNRRGSLQVAVLYTPQQQQHGRMLIEQRLRNQFNPSCGVN